MNDMLQPAAIILALHEGVASMFSAHLHNWAKPQNQVNSVLIQKMLYARCLSYGLGRAANITLCCKHWLRLSLSHDYDLRKGTWNSPTVPPTAAICSSSSKRYHKKSLPNVNLGINRLSRVKHIKHYHSEAKNKNKSHPFWSQFLILMTSTDPHFLFKLKLLFYFLFLLPHKLVIYVRDFSNYSLFRRNLSSSRSELVMGLIFSK